MVPVSWAVIEKAPQLFVDHMDGYLDITTFIFQFYDRDVAPICVACCNMALLSATEIEYLRAWVRVSACRHRQDAVCALRALVSSQISARRVSTS